MRRGFMSGLCALFFLLTTGLLLSGQTVVDRIVARVENDIILQSDVQELKEYQELVDGKSQGESVILDLLIDQWIVRSEANLSRFPEPTDAAIDQELSQVVKSFSPQAEFETRKKKSGLNDAEVRKIIAAQLYLSNYLDSRFRPSAQIDEKAIQDFYQSAVVPRAKARGQEPPTLDASRDIIQEALVQGDINQQADRWLKESRARLHVQKFVEEGAK
jgi:peptidyl-prolyl cis-trans isomerase SurA